MNRRRFAAALFAASLSSPFAVAVPTVAHAQTEMDDPFKGPLPDTNGVKYELGPDMDERVKDIAKDLGCICGTCPHEPVSTCTCGTANRIRAQIALGISQGKDKDAILGTLTEKFGDGVIPKPPFSGINLIAWIGPFVAIAFAAWWVRAKALASWQQNSAAHTPPPSKTDAPSEDPYLSAVDAELKAREQL